MSERIHNIFSNISGNYDTMNRILSLGIDVGWRKVTVQKIIELNKARNPKILDIATGTGDLAFMLEQTYGKDKATKVIGMDFNKDMLHFAKIRGSKSRSRVIFQEDDAMKMRYKSGCFDIVTSGFALRNFDDLQVFAKELRRVMKPGGVFVLLDMAKPDDPYQSAFFSFYSVFMRFVGMFENNEAYKWLVGSIKRFDKKRLMKILKAEGFKDIRIEPLRTGVAYIVYGRK